MTLITTSQEKPSSNISTSVKVLIKICTSNAHSTPSIIQEKKKSSSENTAKVILSLFKNVHNASNGPNSKLPNHKNMKSSLSQNFLKWTWLQVWQDSRWLKVFIFLNLEQINPALTQSWLGNNNFNPLQDRSKQFEGDDSRSIYFSRVEKEKVLAQSQVWQAPEIQRNNESMYLSQMKPNPYSAS